MYAGDVHDTKAHFYVKFIEALSLFCGKSDCLMSTPPAHSTLFDEIKFLYRNHFLDDWMGNLVKNDDSKATDVKRA